MKIITDISKMKAEIKSLKYKGKIIGLVPTMGYLHEGHLSLVRESIKKTDCTVVSIFVNPAQFGPREDFKEYPRDLNRDYKILEKEGVDYIFYPRDSEMYPMGYKTYIEVHGLQDRLCGFSRHGHFKGVCTVVLKLFNIINPDISFFGQKDAQQAIILKRMVRDINLDVKINVLPILRDKNGLALSSRNSYLTQEQRNAALSLSRSLKLARQMIESGERKTEKIIQKMKVTIESEPFTRIDYVEIVDLEELNPIDRIDKEVLIAIAVFVGKIRLIDNIIVKIKE